MISVQDYNRITTWIDMASQPESNDIETSDQWREWVTVPVVNHNLAPREMRAAGEVVGILKDSGCSIHHILKGVQRGMFDISCETLRVTTTKSMRPQRGDVLVVKFEDLRLFKSWLLLTKSEKEKVGWHLLAKEIGARLVVLPPGIKMSLLRVAARPLQKLWYVLSGNRRADRLVERAIRDWEKETSR